MTKTIVKVRSGWLVDGKKMGIHQFEHYQVQMLNGLHHGREMWNDGSIVCRFRESFFGHQKYKHREVTKFLQTFMSLLSHSVLQYVHSSQKKH
jgi:hypothetical protein